MIRGYWLRRLIRRNWPLVVVTLLVSVAAATLVTLAVPPQYAGVAKLFVTTRNATSLVELSQGGIYVQQVVGGLADVATSPYVLDPAARRIGLRSSRPIAGEVAVDVPLNTSILEIRVHDRSPAQAAALANAVASELTARVGSLVPPSSGSAPLLKVTQTQQAVPDPTTRSPQPLANLGIGVLVGLLLGLLLAYVRQSLDDRVYTDDDLARTTDRPVLAKVQVDGLAHERGLAAWDAPPNVFAEAMRTLRSAVAFARLGRTTQTILVTSALPGDGKTTVTVNLAAAVALADERVVVVDADLRDPGVAAHLDLDGSTGLVDVLRGAPLASAVQQVVVRGRRLHVLPGGAAPADPLELIQSREMGDVLDDLRRSYDLVVIDSPPIVPVSDALVLSTAVDGVLVVCGSGNAVRAQLTHSFAALAATRARVLGLVLNRAPVDPRDRGAYRAYAPDATREESARTRARGELLTDP